MNGIDTQNGFALDLENLPLRRPGVYLVRHNQSGLCYVGISKNVFSRVRSHARGQKSSTLLQSAIAVDGVGAFEVVPLYYSISGNGGLASVEADLIKDYNSIKNGFNVIERSSGVGKYGEAFAARVKMGQSAPECVAKLAAYNADPEKTKVRAEAIKRGWANLESRALQRDRANAVGISRLFTAKAIANRLAAEATPETKKRRSDVMNSRYADPEYRARHLANVQAANANPSRNDAISAARTGGRWITNGEVSSFIRTGQPLPIGWRYGTLRRHHKL